MNWYVVYTKPKWEKKVANQLNQIGVKCYCPLKSEIKQWSDRKKKVETPLFNGHIFVQLEENKRNEVFQIHGAVRYLFWLGKPAVVRDEEISAIKKWLLSPDEFEVLVTTYKIGDEVEIESGPFISQKAKVKEVNKTHYVLILESLGCIIRIKHICKS